MGLTASQSTEPVSPAAVPATRPLAATASAGPPWLRPVHRRRDIDLTWLAAAGVMAFWGWAFFGWRALLQVSLSLAGGAVSLGLGAWLIRRWGGQQRDSALQALVLAMLAGMSLPVLRQPAAALLAGLTAGALAQVVGRAWAVRLHPVAGALAVVWLASWLLGGGAGAPPAGLKAFQPVPAVLRPERLFLGDVTDYAAGAMQERWQRTDRNASSEAGDAIHRPFPYHTLIDHQRRLLEPGRFQDMLVSGELPRLETLLLGAVPGPVGASGAALLLLLGLVLMYRRLLWWGMAAAALAGAVGTLALLPVEADGEVTVMAARLADLGPAVGAVYLAYLLLSSPLVLLAMVLGPQTAPLSRTGRVIYGLILGGGVILGPWLTDRPEAAYLPLLAASLLSRPLDALHTRPLGRSSPS